MFDDSIALELNDEATRLLELFYNRSNSRTSVIQLSRPRTRETLHGWRLCGARSEAAPKEHIWY